MIPQLVGAAWWWVGTALGGGLVLLIAGWMMRRTGIASAKQRLGEWGVVAAMLVAALRMGPTWLPVLSPIESTAAQAQPSQPIEVEWIAQPTATDEADGDVLMPAEQFVGPHAPVTPAWVSPVGWLDGLMIAYVALAGFFFARWLIGQWGLTRLLRKSHAASMKTQRLFDAQMQEAPNRVRLAVSDRVAVPMCCGLWRPTVVLPQALEESADTTTLRWIFAHELTHLRRHDPWSSWLMGLAQAVYFYVPWFWWVRRQVRLCQEYVADAAAAAQGQWADDYAQFLVSLARSPVAPLGATGVLGSHSDLYRRVDMVLKPVEQSGGKWSRGRILVGATGMFAVAVLASGLGVKADPPKSDKPGEVNFVWIADTDDTNLEKRIAELEKKLAERKEDVGPKHPDVKNLEKKLEALRDELKKSGSEGGEKRKSEAKVIIREINPADVMKNIDLAEMQKKIRAALEEAKLSQDQIDKVLAELKKVHQEQIRVFHGNALMGEGGGAGLGANGPVTMRFRAIGHQGGRLGIETEPVGGLLEEQLGLPHGQGLVIRRVMPESPADKAGFKTNDILLSFNGKPVPNEVMSFVKIVEGIESGKEVDAMVLRKGKKETLSGIKLAEAKKEASAFGSTGGKFDVAVDHNHAFARLADAERAAASKKPGKMVSVTINNGDFKASEQDGDVRVVVTGKMNGKKVDVTGVTITEPGVSLNLDTMDRVPDKYRKRVQRLIENGSDSPVRFESKRENSDD